MLWRFWDLGLLPPLDGKAKRNENGQSDSKWGYGRAVK